MAKIMVSAGEVSGDMHAAAVLKKVKQKLNNLEIFGMGSTALKDLGAEIVIDPTQISTIGYFEALKNIRQHFKHLNQLKELLKARQPDLVFLVDYSAFNMRLAKICKEEGIKAVNYFPPSAWLYNKRRAKKIASYGTHVAAVFPMERDTYRKAGAEVSFVGHPLLDIVDTDLNSAEIKSELGIKNEQKVISLFPGSRRGEIKSLLPEMIKTAVKISRLKPSVEFFIAAAAGIEREYLKSFFKNIDLKINISKNSNYKLMKISEFIISASGTTSLEAAILETPQIIGYKAALSTYLLAKYVFKINYVGLPNIIAEKEIVPELLQKNYQVDKISEIAIKWLNNPQELKKIENKLAVVKEKLGNGGAVEKTAELLIQKGGLKNLG